MLAICALSGAGLAAQDQAAIEPALKAAFLFQFVKFIDWPGDEQSPASTRTLCSTDTLVAGALAEITSGRKVGDHALVVTPVFADTNLPACSLLFVGGSDVKRSAPLLAAVRGQSVFTVGDAPEFVLQGGIAYFFVEGGHMRFAINTAAIAPTRLHVHVQLLSLARIVTPGHER
jgi:hypothetical protein